MGSDPLDVLDAIIAEKLAPEELLLIEAEAITIAATRVRQCNYKSRETA